MKIGYKRTDINTGFAVTVITIKLDAGYAQSPGKVLEFHPGEPV